MRVVTFAAAETGSPDSPEWHAWRAQGLGGSDAGVIAAENGLIEDAPRWLKSAHQLWEIKTGQKKDEFKGNWATERGKHGEAIIRSIYEQQTGKLVQPMFGEMDDWPVLRSSFDGVDMDGSVITEIKCPGAAVHNMAKNGEIVPYYKPQVTHQALTALGHPDRWNLDHEIHFVSGVPETRDIALVRVRAGRAREFALRLFDAEQVFWKFVTQNRPLAGADWMPLALAWREAKRLLGEAEGFEEEARKVLIAYAKQSGSERLEGEGVSLALETRAGAIDYKAALAKHAPDLQEADLSAFRRKGSESWVPRLTTAKAN